MKGDIEELENLRDTYMSKNQEQVRIIFIILYEEKYPYLLSIFRHKKCKILLQATRIFRFHGWAHIIVSDSASGVILWYELIHSMWYSPPDQVAIVYTYKLQLLFTFLARLNNVHGELLNYPRR